jgi:hypothetical protein
VRRAGCDVGQGYLFSPSLRPERVELWMMQHDARNAAHLPMFEPRPLLGGRFPR